MSIREQLEEIKQNGLRELENFADAKELDNIRVRYLGKKGELTAILKQMGKLSAEERPIIGQVANEVRQTLEAAVQKSLETLKEKEMALRLAKRDGRRNPSRREQAAGRIASAVDRPERIDRHFPVDGV